jgi:hypothetical protein
VDRLDGGGAAGLQPVPLGRKVSDEFTVPLCRTHHREVHNRGREAIWWTKKNIDPLSAPGYRPGGGGSAVVGGGDSAAAGGGAVHPLLRAAPAAMRICSRVCIRSLR